MSDPELDLRADEELAQLARTSVEAEGALLSRYLRLIRYYAGRFAQGGDVDDLVQEGLIALLQAIPEFDPAREKHFSAFAQVCICNRMRSFLRRERNAASPAEDLLEELEARGEFVDPDTPESILLEREAFRDACLQVMAQLSDREWRILQVLLDGASYQDAAGKLGVSVKSIDNAMQRIRRKMRAVRGADHSEQT